ncbi:hypothetical protein PR048_012726 [Dryococelus australis]|uniref:PiggyBac transposable element-derived protein domain-containing protein n=1 Tax=Dryococelus australis TaxID=614101 RepID=A0ABQ9HQ65_9NEOP|nr:hypothetical protein PR048_012726 [Dryococelus australis]
MIRDVEDEPFQSNLYAMQNEKILNLKREDLGLPVITNAMPRDHFETILWYLHVNDNTSMPHGNKDKRYKLCIDESIILFKGHSTLKQYNLMKPIKCGYKLWAMADGRSSTLGFKVYQGKDELAETEFQGYSLGERGNPTIVSGYDQHMGGVDHADRLRQLYCVDRKSRKWWHRLFWGMCDIAFINAFVMYKELFDKGVSLLGFRISVSQDLITHQVLKAKRRCSKNRGASPGTKTAAINVKSRKSNFSVPNDVRIFNCGTHWPVFDSHRGRCEVYSSKNIQSRPFSQCSHCKVFLHMNEKRGAFWNITKYSRRL